VYFVLMAGLLALLCGNALVSRLKRPKPWFTYSMTRLDQGAYDQLAKRPGWAQSVLTMADKVPLAGLVSRPPRPDAPWVLFFPGNDATQLARGQRLLEQIRAEHPWGLFLYATRGYDASSGTPSPEAYASDAQQVLTTVMRENGIAPAQVHLVAFSLGGYSAFHALNQAAKLGHKPQTLSLLASVARVAMVRRNFLERFATGDIYDVLPLLGEIPGPVLVVQGTADEAFGERRQDKLLAERLGDRGRYLEVPGVGHGALLESPIAISAVRAMIEAHSATTASEPAVRQQARVPTDASNP
jgi:pimeloyl-ACP methyl ester carboxylesterase